MAADDLKQAVSTALEGVRSLKNGQDEIKKGVITSLNAVSELDQRETDTRQAVEAALDGVKALDSRETETRQFVEVALEATQELKDVSDSHRVQLVNHGQRLGAVEERLESSPTPSPAQPTAAPTATITPQLRTDDVPDLPDPVVTVVHGGLVIDRVQRTNLAIAQLPEVNRDIDATGETSNLIRQASIPPRQPQPLHRTLTRAEVEEQDRKRKEEDQRLIEGWRGRTASETTTPSILEQSRAEQEKKEKDGDKLHPMWIVGLAVLVIAILIALTILFSSMGKGRQQSSIPTPTPTTQSAPTTNTSKSESNFTFQKGSLSGANVTFNGDSVPESNQAPQTEE